MRNSNLYRMVCLAICLCTCHILGQGIPYDQMILVRGDANLDGEVDGADASYIANYLFHSGPAPLCMNQADANNDGAVSAIDATYILDWLYSGGPQPPSPGPFNTVCTADDSPYPGCSYSPCE
jgi:hypothetical protein